jgi:hypothetical protein
VLSERYRIESVLGEGGMGAVYLAEHVLMRKRLAVKVLHPEMTRMPEMVARFEREAMAAAHIEHPNVAAATDFGKIEDGSFFLVLEYVEGTSLRDLIAQGPLATERALHIAYQMTSGLSRSHALATPTRSETRERDARRARETQLTSRCSTESPRCRRVRRKTGRRRRAGADTGMFWDPEYGARTSAGKRSTRVAYTLGSSSSRC